MCDAIEQDTAKSDLLAWPIRVGTPTDDLRSPGEDLNRQPLAIISQEPRSEMPFSHMDKIVHLPDSEVEHVIYLRHRVATNSFPALGLSGLSGGPLIYASINAGL